MLPGIGTRTSGPLFKHHDRQFIADGWLSQTQLLGSTCDSLVQAQTGFNADDQQIQHIRETTPNARLPCSDPVTQPEVRHEKSESYRREVNKKRTVVPGSSSKCQHAENKRNYCLRTIKKMDCGVATIAGSDQTLLHHRNLCLAFRHDALHLLHHDTQCGACLLHRLPKVSLLLARRDHGGDPLDHGLTVEQNQST